MFNYDFFSFLAGIVKFVRDFVFYIAVRFFAFHKKNSLRFQHNLYQKFSEMRAKSIIKMH